MVYKCCVPRCNGNYTNGPKVRLFSFPKDDELRRRWIVAIHRNFTPTVHSKVCELHFAEADIQTYTEYYDERTGNKHQIPLKQYRLKPFSVPCLLPNCPQYLSTVKHTREDPDEKRVRLENMNIQEAIAQSLVTDKEYQQQKNFSTLSELKLCLEKENLSEEWTILSKPVKTLFLLIDSASAPVIIGSAVIDENLAISIFHGQIQLKSLGSQTFPRKVSCINDVSNILDMLRDVCIKDNQTVSDYITSVQGTLQTVANLLEDKATNLEFLSEQLNLINTPQERLRYSPHYLIMCCILFSISPHAYKFMRSSNYFVLPHPRTLRKICSTYNTNPINEQSDSNFLSFLKDKFPSLKKSDLTLSLMVDEIHIKPYLDYKAGNILGAAYDSENVATSAYVFMIQSMLSSYKEVVHILPVRKLQARQLFTYIRKTVTELHHIGFKVICVVSDNNSINKKAMTYFTDPPKTSLVYPHPSNSHDPLFFIIDAVHIFKNIRNNWINQKDQNLNYPDFDSVDLNIRMSVASFSSLKELHALESHNLVRYSYGLSFKALFPTNFERQNVKLVQNIFNENVVQGLLHLGERNNLPNYQGTANFISLIVKWWNVVNVKTVNKGVRFNNPLQNPLTVKGDEENLLFLRKFLKWLDVWKEAGKKANCFTQETHWAISQTTHGLLELADYCINELGFQYFLPGKIQTDALEARFGNYRTFAGSQYLVSLRQIFEVESKIRMQNLLPLTMESSMYGKISISFQGDTEPSTNIIEDPDGSIVKSAAVASEIASNIPKFGITLSEADFKQTDPLLPVLTYLSGYCAHAVLKRLKCEYCSKHVLVDKKLLPVNSGFSLINNLDRGGLVLPSADLVNAKIFNYIMVSKLINGETERDFLKCSNQREVVIALTTIEIKKAGFFLNDFNCERGHSRETFLRLFLSASTNTLLNDYVKKKNDGYSSVKKKRKIQTVKI